MTCSRGCNDWAVLSISVLWEHWVILTWQTHSFVDLTGLFVFCFIAYISNINYATSYPCGSTKAPANSENNVAARTWVARMAGGLCYADGKDVAPAWSVTASVNTGLPMERARTLVQHKILEHKQSQLPGKRLVTSVDVCKGSFHIDRAVGKLRASEGLLELDHAAYGMLAAQGPAGPVFTLGSGSCLQEGIGISLKPSYQMFKESPHMSHKRSHIKIHYLPI